MTSALPDPKHDFAGYTNPSVQRGLEEQLARIVRGFPQFRKICDLGCGNGRFALSVAGNGRDVIGVDGSAVDIADAQAAAGSRRDAVFIQAEIDEKLPARLLADGGPFDAALSIDVVEHLYRPRALIEVAGRIIRPGGHLVVCTPYHGYFKNLAISLLAGWDSHHAVHWDGGHIKFFSVRTLRGLVEEGGFVDLKFSFFGRAPFLWKNMICVARKPP